MTDTHPIDRLFAEHPAARGRLIRAAVVAIRSSGLRLADRPPASFDMRADGTIGVRDAQGRDIVRLPLDDLARPVD